MSNLREDGSTPCSIPAEAYDGGTRVPDRWDSCELAPIEGFTLFGYFVRFGFPAQVQPAISELVLSPRTNVVVEMEDSGLQFATIVSKRKTITSNDDMKILRIASMEDRWLHQRIRKKIPSTVEAARKFLGEVGSQTILLDIDLNVLADAIVIHFLGTPDAVTEEAMPDLTSLIQNGLGLEELRLKIEVGCGEGCGSSNSSCGSCSSCSMGH